MHLFHYYNNKIESTLETWDNKIMPANSAVNYNTNRYITINYNTYKKLSHANKKKLIAHESYHFYQDILGYKMVASNNIHLDYGEGRILLRCELNALHCALKGDASSLKDALHIRVYRQNKYQQNNEAEFELNEGLAEFTSIIYTCKDIEEIKSTLLNSIKNNNSIGFTNYFAYITGSIYAYLSYLKYPEWKNHINDDISNMLKSSLNIPTNICKIDIDILNKYNYIKIQNEESNIVNTYNLTNTLKGDNCIKISNNNLNIIFNPNDRVIEVNDSIVSLNNIQLKSDWGILKAYKGLMRSKDWSYFVLPPPVNSKKNKITGNYYELILNEDFKLTKEGKIWKITNLKN